MGKSVIAGLLLVAIVAGSLAGAKSTDADVLAKIGTVVGRRTTAALPDRSNLAGPITTFRLGDRLPLEERVRLRIHGEKSLGGIAVEVLPGNAPGEVRIRGIVAEVAVARKALEIAAATNGVDKVIDEVAVPEKPAE